MPGSHVPYAASAAGRDGLILLSTDDPCAHIYLYVADNTLIMEFHFLSTRCSSGKRSPACSRGHHRPVGTGHRVPDYYYHHHRQREGCGVLFEDTDKMPGVAGGGAQVEDNLDYLDH